VRKALVAALVSCIDSPNRSLARRFLRGLSRDELEYIAEFLGACILESPGRRCCSRTQMAEIIAEFQQGRPGNSPDQEHKMILLLEFLFAGTLSTGQGASAFPRAPGVADWSAGSKG
jgi:hypothetical protein